MAALRWTIGVYLALLVVSAAALGAEYRGGDDDDDDSKHGSYGHGHGHGHGHHAPVDESTCIWTSDAGLLFDFSNMFTESRTDIRALDQNGEQVILYAINPCQEPELFGCAPGAAVCSLDADSGSWQTLALSDTAEWSTDEDAAASATVRYTDGQECPLAGAENATCFATLVRFVCDPDQEIDQEPIAVALNVTCEPMQYGESNASLGSLCTRAFNISSRHACALPPMPSSHYEGAGGRHHKYGRAMSLSCSLFAAALGLFLAACAMACCVRRRRRNAAAGRRCRRAAAIADESGAAAAAPAVPLLPMPASNFAPMNMYPAPAMPEFYPIAPAGWPVMPQHPVAYPPNMQFGAMPMYTPPVHVDSTTDTSRDEELARLLHTELNQ